MSDYDRSPTNPHHGGKMTPQQMADRIEELTRERDDFRGLADKLSEEAQTHHENANAQAYYRREAEARAARLREENERLRRTVEAAAILGRIVGWLGDDEGRIEAFREAVGDEMIDRARAALAAQGETK